MISMELTQKDYEERVNRVAAGNGDDEDLRLVKHYEDEGFSTREDSAGKRNARADEQHDEQHDEQQGEQDKTAKATQPGEVKPAKQAPTARGTSTSFGKSQN